MDNEVISQLLEFADKLTLIAFLLLALRYQTNRADKADEELHNQLRIEAAKEA